MRERQALRAGDDIAARLLDVGAAALALARKLARDVGGRHVAAQVVRSGTAAGANYEEARAAESRADFVHKIRIATKELRETLYWMRLIERSHLAPAIPKPSLAAFTRELDELTAILIASARTARVPPPP